MKGFFSRARLSVAGKYLTPSGQRGPYLIGLILAIPLVALFAISAFGGEGELVSNGPLSSNHALFGQDCATCHQAFGSVTDARCESCHETAGDAVKAHGFDTHYRYRSADFDRSAASSKEGACFSCHTEHRGRDAVITRVANTQCASCHFRSFDEHPEFEFVAEGLKDPANLKFEHTIHVKEVRDAREIVDIEQTCLTCHIAEDDGATFKPISFETNCGECHLTSSTSTRPVTVLAGADDNRPGVLSLETIRNRQGPGTRWSFFANPNEFQLLGESVVKRPVYHADEWVMENLRFLRDRLYPRAELADLLRGSADAPPRNTMALYEEAVRTLRARIAELRDDPRLTVQAELTELQKLLATVQQRLDDPFSPLDQSRFVVSVGDADSSITGAEREAYEQVINDLSNPCQECHFVQQATIKAVQKDQRSLVRAEFNHRSHVLHARCLDCHNQIPIRENVADDLDATEDTDNAEILNDPPLATCRTCHAPKKAGDDCTTCHVFHPDKGKGSDLLRPHR
jgi:hypothetical protein